MADKDVYYAEDGLPVLYRRRGLQCERWDRVTRVWVEDWDWYGDVLDGGASWDILTEEQARHRFPAAFR